MSHSDFFIKLSDNHPFITVCVYAGQEYVGVIQNRDDAITTIYDYGAIVESDLKNRFLELGDTWWWESNRLIPINMFLKEDWAPFRRYLRTFNNKGLDIIHGPVCSMNDLVARKSKRRSITLVKRMY
jgi:hypothetical protein